MVVKELSDKNIRDLVGVHDFWKLPKDEHENLENMCGAEEAKAKRRRAYGAKAGHEISRASIWHSIHMGFGARAFRQRNGVIWTLKQEQTLWQRSETRSRLEAPRHQQRLHHDPRTPWKSTKTTRTVNTMKMTTVGNTRPRVKAPVWISTTSTYRQQLNFKSLLQ
jgi:hypothetical protein